MFELKMQSDLFGETYDIGISITDAAEIAKVSTATIRNWLKTGYLLKLNTGRVDGDSLNQFMKNIAGKEKLVLRANKSQKDFHNHLELSEILKNGLDSTNWSEISLKYEDSLSDSFRNKEGIYYTPSNIVADMLADIQPSPESTFLDPCCGSGNFIIEAIKSGVNPVNVYGYDIDPNAVEITKKRIYELTGYNASNNIIQMDFLENAASIAKNQAFDLIFTNPPWGKKIKKDIKEAYALQYGAGKSIDTTSLFYFASMKLLNDMGTLGFLVQEALFNISTFQDARKNIIKHEILRLVDYDRSFKGLLTKAQAFIIRNKKNKNDLISCENKSKQHFRSQSSFTNNPKQILNFWTNNSDSSIIDHVYNLPHITLEGVSKWALGIVTGNNSRFCKNNQMDGYVPVVKGADITRSGLKNPSNFIPKDFSNFQQVAPISMYHAPEKIIYKFISSNLAFFCDTEQRYVLNSANILIPDSAIGITCHQLTSILNSDFMNWLFKSIFRTHKILRGDIEQLPIHSEYFKLYDDFSEEKYLLFLGLTQDKNGTYRIKKTK